MEHSATSQRLGEAQRLARRLHELDQALGPTNPPLSRSQAHAPPRPQSPTKTARRLHRAAAEAAVAAAPGGLGAAAAEEMWEQREVARRFLVSLLLHPPDHSAVAHLRAAARGDARDAPPPTPCYTPSYTPSTACAYTQPSHAQPVRAAYTQPTPDPAYSGRSVWPASLRVPYPATGFATPHEARAAAQASPAYPAAAQAAAVAAELSAAAANAASVAASEARPSCVKFSSPGMSIAAARQMHFQ